MNRVRHVVVTLGTAVSLLLIFSQPVYASIDIGTLGWAVRSWYIDPGTGSIIIQVLIGTLVAGVAMIGMYRVRVKMFFSNLFAGRRREKEGGESEDSK